MSLQSLTETSDRCNHVTPRRISKFRNKGLSLIRYHLMRGATLAWCAHLVQYILYIITTLSPGGESGKMRHWGSTWVMN